MDIVEREHERLRGGELREQPPQPAPDHEPLVAAGAVGGDGAGDRGDGGREIGVVATVARAGGARRARGAVERFGEGVGDDVVGEVALRGGGAAVQHRGAARGGARVQRVEQARLADAGLAGDRQHAAAPGGELGERGVDRRQLAVAPDQRRRLVDGEAGHRSDISSRARRRDARRRANYDPPDTNVEQGD